MYSPVLDRQRYCDECKQWYHEGCMERVGRPKKLDGVTAADCLMKLPIFRGWDGNHDAEDWMMVGTGRKLEAVRADRGVAATSANLEDEWKRWSDLLSPEFVQHVRGRTFIRYLCPLNPLHHI
jgi:hypothetical protein